MALQKQTTRLRRQRSHQCDMCSEEGRKYRELCGLYGELEEQLLYLERDKVLVDNENEALHSLLSSGERAQDYFRDLLTESESKEKHRIELIQTLRSRTNLHKEHTLCSLLTTTADRQMSVITNEREPTVTVGGGAQTPDRQSRQASVKQLKTELNNLGQQNTDLESQLESANDVKAELQVKVMELGHQLKDAREKRNDLEGELSKVKSKLVETESKHKQVVEELRALRELLGLPMDSDARVTEERLTRLRAAVKQFDVLKKQFGLSPGSDEEEIQKQATEWRKALDRLENIRQVFPQSQNVVQAVKQLKRAEEASKSKVADLESTLRRTVQERDRLKKEKESHTASIKGLQNQVKELDSIIHDMVSKRSVKKHQLSAMGPTPALPPIARSRPVQGSMESPTPRQHKPSILRKPSEYEDCLAEKDRIISILKEQLIDKDKQIDGLTLEISQLKQNKQDKQDKCEKQDKQSVSDKSKRPKKQ